MLSNLSVFNVQLRSETLVDRFHLLYSSKDDCRIILKVALPFHSLAGHSLVAFSLDDIPREAARGIFAASFADGGAKLAERIKNVSRALSVTSPRDNECSGTGISHDCRAPYDDQDARLCQGEYSILCSSKVASEMVLRKLRGFTSNRIYHCRKCSDGCASCKVTRIRPNLCSTCRRLLRVRAIAHITIKFRLLK